MGRLPRHGHRAYGVATRAKASPRRREDAIRAEGGGRAREKKTGALRRRAGRERGYARGKSRAYTCAGHRIAAAQEERRKERRGGERGERTGPRPTRRRHLDQAAPGRLPGSGLCSGLRPSAGLRPPFRPSAWAPAPCTCKLKPELLHASSLPRLCFLPLLRLHASATPRLCFLPGFLCSASLLSANGNAQRPSFKSARGMLSSPPLLCSSFTSLGAWIYSGSLVMLYTCVLHCYLLLVFHLFLLLCL